MKESLTIALVGDPKVGKDAVGASIQGIAIPETYTSTIGYKKFIAQQGTAQQNLKLEVVSIAGSEASKPHVPLYVRNADVLVLVYDTTNQASFKHLQEWFDLANKGTQKDCVKIVIGNKSDLPTREVTEEAAQEFAAKKGALHFEVSAKKGTNIKEFIRTAVTEHLSRAVKVQLHAKEDIEHYLDRVTKIDHDWTLARGIFKAKLLDGAVPYLRQEMQKLNATQPNQDISIDALLNTPIPKDKLGLNKKEMAQFDKYLPKQTDTTLREIFAFRSNFMSMGNTRTSQIFDPEVIKSQMLHFLNKEVSYLKADDPKLPLLKKMVNDIGRMNPPIFTSLSELCEHKIKDSKGKETNIAQALNLKQNSQGQSPSYNRFCKEFKLSVKDAEAVLTRNPSGPRQPSREPHSKK